MLWLRFEARAWVRITVCALVGAVAITAVCVIAAGVSVLSWTGVLLIGAAGGVVGALFGVLLGQRSESFAILDALGSRRARAAALRAVRRGPVPADPVIRHAAYALACRQLLSTERSAQRRNIAWTLVFAGLFVVLAVVDHSWAGRGWKLAAAVLYASPLAVYPRTLRRLRERIPLLADSDSDGSVSGPEE